MKGTVSFVLICILFSSCSHRIVRNGYTIQEDLIKDCDIAIQRNISIPDTIAQKIGEIKVGDSGFSVSCSEEQAIAVLKREACSIDADLILITHEKRPDFWSSCYRCEAEFYKLRGLHAKQNYETDSNYGNDEVKIRVKNDRNKNVLMAISAAVAGAVSGILMGTLIY